MQRLSFCFPLVAVFCVTATDLPRQAAASERVTPALNKESTAQVGEHILHQGEFYPRDAIHLSERITFGERQQYSLTQGYYFRTGQSIGWETYAPAGGPNAGRVQKAHGTITLQGSFHYSNELHVVHVLRLQRLPNQARSKAVVPVGAAE